MATVTGLTAARMIAIEASSVVGGVVNGGGHLILTKHDASTIDAGSVIGPTGSPGVTQPQLDTFMEDHVPIGSSIDYIGTVSPSTKWILGTGQTIINGQTLYATFWSRIPLSMKSGANIIMPDTRGRVSVGYDATQTEFDAIGETGGVKSQTLSQAQLPVATITIDPPSTAVTGSVGNDTPDHGHAFNVNSSEGLDDSVSSYLLTPYTGGSFVTQVAGGPHAIDINAGSGVTVQTTPYTSAVTPDITHYHNVAGSTVGANARHQHPAGTLAVNIPAFNSGALGSGASVPNLQPYITMQKLFKVL